MEISILNSELKLISWMNDPFLLGNIANMHSNQVTANDFIQQNERDKFIFSNTLKLNLYSMIIRKKDFLTNRVLQSMPYVILTNEWARNIRDNSLKIAERCFYYFQKTKVNFKVLKWQEKIIKYIVNQNRIPFPIFRLVDGYEEITKKNNVMSFQSARGEDFQLPLYLTEELAYLIGVIMGDGHLAEYFVNIIDASKKHIQNLELMLSKHFKSKTEIYKQENANAWNVNILGKWIVRFISFISGQPIAERKYSYLKEPLIFRENPTFRKMYWRGVMDADAGYKNDLSFISASQSYTKDFMNYLTEYNISFRPYTIDTNLGKGYGIRISGESRKQFQKLIGSNHPQKETELELLVARTMPKKNVPRKGDSSWIGKVTGFQRDRIKNDYFDFSVLFDIGVVNAGMLISKIRNEPKNFLEEKLSLSQGLLTYYENNTLAVPLGVLKELLTISNSNLDLVSVLEQYKLTYFSSKRSKAQLPLKPSRELLQLLQGLQIKEGGYFFLVGLPDQTIQEFRTKISKLFDIQLPSKKRVYNSVICSFITKFCILEE
ncbi:MAG: hypothetical protein JXA54_06840 [Candidatus Heimdallarchaeota archaeon]|nr:hypothetical protein [Candidatus Heimdallarchaeota archaeon]